MPRSRRRTSIPRNESAAVALSETKVERRYDEQVEQRRREQAAQDHDRQRVLDPVARDRAGDDERDQGEARRQRGHSEMIPSSANTASRPPTSAIALVDPEDCSGERTQ